MAYEDHGPFAATRSDLYAEYGLTDDWTLAGKFETVDFDTSDVFDSDGYRVAVRRALWRDDFWSSSLSLGLVEGAAIGGFRGCESRGAEMEIAAGRSGFLGEDPFFTGLTLGYRSHEDACQSGRMELVLGVQDVDGFTYTVQLWSERGDNGASDKVEFMLSRQFGDVEVGFATREEVGGEFEERAFVLSVALRH